jgi:hypothetical protein
MVGKKVSLNVLHAHRQRVRQGTPKGGPSKKEGYEQNM